MIIRMLTKCCHLFNLNKIVLYLLINVLIVIPKASIKSLYRVHNYASYITNNNQVI
jgi:hypothetical protein